ncbi:MAG: 50S ribosomal protein L4 [Candidatus Gracilibacteria bacterium]|nr:50S ribosomal protein L4 [Candidatus Gracilibacteria bacterium]MDD3119819.1 50S ribosomal protein L4 [Candidatus Gracilibacteria bacterium]MDD4530450.1 50S ribosomal protein L4 [Candidatus Gracilibacteria bacterium]
MEAVLYNDKGVEKGKIELNEKVFGVEIKPSLIHRLLMLQRSNARVNLAQIKTRGEVKGSTRKIYKQKGTGGARAGASRSPIRRGGGVVFGPRGNRNFTVSMNRKERRAALFCLLSSKAQSSSVKVIENLDNSVEAKTKSMVSVFNSMNATYATVALNKQEVNAMKAIRNIPNVKAIYVNYLNPADLLKYKDLVFTKASLEELNGIYL